MICTSHTGEAPHSVYRNRIRPAGHSFTKLLSEIPDFSIKISDSKLEGELNRLMTAEVSERYCFEISSESDLLKEFNINDTKLDEKIEEARQLHKTTKTLRQRVWDVRKNAFKGLRTLPPHLVKDVLQRIKTK